ncbi:hypothetical protein H0H92_008772 [Tricholoma furcatifolium]|nr:hypothetical protein H0H92_008772 [Tricholoma furcatifolium]
MANLLRTAKSGSRWTQHDLDSYKIDVKEIPYDDFFPGQLSAYPSIQDLDPDLLTSEVTDNPADIPEGVRDFFAYLRLSMIYRSHETLIDDLMRETLRHTGYNRRNDHNATLLNTGFITSLLVVGDASRAAQTDVSLMHQRTLILLLVVENKTVTNPANPEPQVIAEAIAAFQHNNERRRKLDLPTLENMTIPCMTIIGSRPTFYIVPVTGKLNQAVAAGSEPADRTEVRRCDVGTSALGSTSGDRSFTLTAFVAFRGLAEICYEEILVGTEGVDGTLVGSEAAIAHATAISDASKSGKR